tara:strand:- start:750 stop:866 length:117 start_codon:yes stop_codon:yes gene_type:complete
MGNKNIKNITNGIVFPVAPNFKLRGADTWGIMAKPPRV